MTELFQKMEKNNSDKLLKINEVSNNYKILNIEIISSCFEPKGLILKINPYGYENSLRKKKKYKDRNRIRKF